MNANQAIIQVLNAEYCGDIFFNDEDIAKGQFREYAKAIHPDICRLPDANKAFERLNRLWSEAERNFSHATWESSWYLWYDQNKAIRYKDRKPFEGGMRYTGDEDLIWAFDKDKAKFADRFFQAVKGIHYRDQRIEDIYALRIPRIDKQAVIYDGGSVPPARIFLKKNKDEFPLDLLLKVYENQLDGRDICWMISRAVDLCCFLHSCGIVHNGISVETLYVNPLEHSLHLYGGWQYAVKMGEKMTGATREIYQLMPTSARTTGISTPVTDMECVRDIFRGIVKNSIDVPKVVIEWTERGSGSNPIEEYTQWNLVLDRAYGARQFKPLPVKSGKIYGNK